MNLSRIHIYLAAAAGAPVTCMETAGEGGPDGMALLAADRLYRRAGETLAAYLNRCVFADARSCLLYTSPAPLTAEQLAGGAPQVETTVQ